MSQASTTAAVAAVNTQQQQQAFITDPMNNPYSKWTPTVIPSAADSYQCEQRFRVARFLYPSYMYQLAVK
jgi:hypothetical protein